MYTILGLTDSLSQLLQDCRVLVEHVEQLWEPLISNLNQLLKNTVYAIHIHGFLQLLTYLLEQEHITYGLIIVLVSPYHSRTLLRVHPVHCQYDLQKAFRGTNQYFL